MENKDYICLMDIAAAHESSQLTIVSSLSNYKSYVSLTNHNSSQSLTKNYNKKPRAISRIK